MQKPSFLRQVFARFGWPASIFLIEKSKSSWPVKSTEPRC